MNDAYNIILATAGALAFVALVYMSAFELGTRAGIAHERRLADRRIQGILDYENARRPKSAKNRRKAQRKAVRA
jgi:hypothetical protein